MNISDDQIQFLNKKVERFESQVVQYKKQVQDSAEDLKDAENIDTTNRWIKEYSEKLERSKQVLDILQLIQSTVEEKDADEGRIKFALQRAFSQTADIEDKYHRRVLTDIIGEFIFN